MFKKTSFLALLLAGVSLLASPSAAANYGVSYSEGLSGTTPGSFSGGVSSGFGEGFGFSNGFSFEESEVCVTGSATVTAEPDLVDITFVAVSEKDTASAATVDVTRKAKDVIAAAEKELMVDLEGKVSAAIPQVLPVNTPSDTEETAVTGYTASAQVSITGADSNLVNVLINAGLKAGADKIQSVEFYCKKYDENYAKALGDAVASARKKAEAVAGADGKEIVGTQKLTETVFANASDGRYVVPAYILEDIVSGGEEDVVRVSPEEIPVTASVTAVYYAG